MISTKSAFLRTCNGTSVWGDIINWSSKIDLFRVLYTIKSTALRLWQSNGLTGNKSQELWSYICSSTEFCWGVPRPVAQERRGCCSSVFPGPATSKAEHIFPTGTYRTTHVLQWIYGYMQTQMASHIDSQRQKHTNATTTNGFILLPAPRKNVYLYTDMHFFNAHPQCGFLT